METKMAQTLDKSTKIKFLKKKKVQGVIILRILKNRSQLFLKSKVRPIIIRCS